MQNQESPICRFIIMSDLRGEDEGKNEKFFISLLDTLAGNHLHPDYFLFLGDIILESKNPKKVRARFEYFKEVFKRYYPVRILLPTVGNHDVGDNPKNDSYEKIFAKVFSEFAADEFLKGYNRTAYYVDIYDVRLIMLNSFHPGECSQISRKQLEWLTQILKEPKKHKLVFLHAPPYPTGHHLHSALDKHQEKRDRFWNIIDKSDVQLVFAGHEHNYSRRLIDASFNSSKYHFERAVNQIITGGAGGPLSAAFEDSQGVIVPPVSAYHYVILDVYRDSLHILAVTLAGEIIDNFKIYKKL